MVLQSSTVIVAEILSPHLIFLIINQEDPRLSRQDPTQRPDQTRQYFYEDKYFLLLPE